MQSECRKLIFFFNDTATTEIYTLSHTTLFRSLGGQRARPPRGRVQSHGGRAARARAPARRVRDLRRPRSRSEEHTSELQSRQYLVCRLLLEKKKRHLLARTFIIRTNLLSILCT